MDSERLGEPLLTSALRVPEASAFTSVEYEPDEDTLYVRVADAGPAVTDVLDDVLVLVDPARRAVVGFDVEGFQRSFLPAHPELARAAEQNQPYVTNVYWLMPWWLTDRLHRAIAATIPV